MSPQLLSITRQISTLPWRDRLTLLGHVFRSLFSASSHIPAMTPPLQGVHLTLAYSSYILP